MIKVYTDGGARGNPGPGAVGVCIFDNDRKLAAFGNEIGITTNNIAEYTAVVQALDWLLANRAAVLAEEVHFFLDSQLVVLQMQGVYRVKNEKIRDLFAQIKKRESELQVKIIWQHVPREENKEADALVNAALDNEKKVPYNKL